MFDNRFRITFLGHACRNVYSLAIWSYSLGLVVVCFKCDEKNKKKNAEAVRNEIAESTVIV